jgi:hypothetical protein
MPMGAGEVIEGKAMTRMIVAAVLTLNVYAEVKAQPRKPAAKAAPAKPAPEPLKLPADAIATAPETWRYTDKQGKEWTYRLTPFGLTRFEERSAGAATGATAAPADAEGAAFEDGDSIRFERPGPFGLYRWQRKKTELNDWEKAVWERAKKKQEAAAAAPKPE